MRISLISQGSNASGIMNTDIVVNVTNPLFLVGNPTSQLEASTKQFVDTTMSNLNINNVTSGTLGIGRLPAFSGVVSSVVGGNVLTLGNSGVVAGEYTKVTVNAGGRVTAGAGLVDEDIPTFNWSRVTTGRPTTLAGYGISDGVLSTGGTLTGNLSLNLLPVNALHAANRTYVDSQLSRPDQEIKTGVIVRRTTDVTPSGFLRVNGAELDRTTFAGLFSAIGERFSIAGGTVPGSGRPWQQQYDINLDANPTLGTWSSAGDLPSVLSYSSAIVTRNRVFLLGGWSGSARTSTIFTAPINADGTLGTWTTAGNLPSALSHSSAIVTRNRVFLLGGHNVSATISTIFTAPINADGTLGTWTTAGDLPSALTISSVIVTGNRVFLLGGHNGSAVISTIFTAPINADGTLGTWTTAGNLPSALHSSSAIVTRNRVFLLGGWNGSAHISTIFTAPINADGTLGTWTTAGNLPSVLSNSSAIVTRNRVFLLGGFNESARISTIFTAPINADGTLGTWTTAGDLPSVLTSSSVIVTGNRVFLLGGHNGSAVISTIFTATLSGATLNDYSAFYDGSIQPTSATTFRLPDYTAQENFSTFFFIKT